MTINLHIPSKRDTLRPLITVIGVGGAGGNAVNNMIAANLEGVNFVVANTDAQALDHALAERTIQLGANITRGLGAGASPDVGRAAAEEAMDEIAASMEGSHMVFITAGMGGGTGTGAAPVVARMARDQGILTVGVVTKPFQFEGSHRMKMAEAGLQELQQYVDTLIVIPNQNLFRVANERTTFADAFKMADEVLHSGVRGVTDLIVKPGLVNLDFADIRTVMREMGKAMMGTGEATGERRAVDAAESAISNPLLDDVSLKGARAVLINITGGLDMTLFEVDEAANRIRDEVDPDANIIFGSTFHEAMEGRMRVSVVATGIDAQAAMQPQSRPAENRAAEKKPFSFSSRGEEQRVTKPASPVMPSAPTIRETVREAREVASQRVAHQQFAQAPRFHQQPAMAQAPMMARVEMPQVAELPFEDEVRMVTREEVAVQQAPAPKFVAAQAEQPATRTLFTPQAPAHQDMQQEVQTQAPAPSFSPKRGMREVRETKSDDHGGSMNLLQKMANVGRVLSASVAKPQEEVVQGPRKFSVSEKPRPDIAEKPQAQVEEEEFDIPAFLRRQAN